MKNINENAPAKNTQSIMIQANVSRVWEVLTTMENWPGWNDKIQKIKLNGPVKVGTTFGWKTAGARIHSTLHTVDAYKYLGWTGKAFGAFAIHNWELTEENGQTKVTVAESMEGWLVKLLRKMMNEKLESGNRDWLEKLKAVCEAQLS